MLISIQVILLASRNLPNMSPNRLSANLSHTNVCIKLHKTNFPNHPILSAPLSCADSITGFGENINTKCSGARSFRNAAPTLWNRLPDKLHQAKDIVSFGRQLRSHLFSTLWSSLSLIPLPRSPPPHLPPLIVITPPFFFFSIFFAKCSHHVVSLLGVLTTQYKWTLTVTLICCKSLHKFQNKVISNHSRHT